MLQTIIHLLLSFILWRSHGQALANGVPVLSFSTSTPAAIGRDRCAALDASGRSWFYAQRADEPQPIASITKLMTALVFLEHNPGWDTTYTFTRDDNIVGGKVNFFPGDEAKIRDIFKSSLVASDNGATIALVHASGLSVPDFVNAMNNKALALGLKHTSFEDPIGLSDNNISTAKEVTLLARAVLSHPEIAAATTVASYDFQTTDGRAKHIESTDDLLSAPGDNGFKILGGKTGYTEEAGYCFVGLFQDPNGREIVSAVLGTAGKNDRFLESKALVDWLFGSYAVRR